MEVLAGVQARQEQEGDLTLTRINSMDIGQLSEVLIRIGDAVIPPLASARAEGDSVTNVQEGSGFFGGYHF